MGTLQDFQDYLANRRTVIEAIETTLCGLQEKYETFFQEVVRVREAELAQLRQAILDGSELPADFRTALDGALAEAATTFESRVSELAAQCEAEEQRAEATRQSAAHAKRKLHGENEDLDHQEEALKVRAVELLDRIKEHNQKISEMGRGFGFFFNLLSMSRVRRERRELQQEQKDVTAHIETLRRRWLDADDAYASEESERESQWGEHATEAAGMRTKLEMLKSTRERILERTALEQVLYARRPELPPPAEGDPACSRCGSANPASYNFCHICAQRLGTDRPDVVGSLDEVAELNLHHHRFSEGMVACQGLIGLIRGLKSGIDAFTESVVDMQNSQNQHSLARLQLEVPEQSVDYGHVFDQVARGLEKANFGAHPTDFAKQADDLIAGYFTEPQIQAWFEAMGEELSVQAEAQW